MIDQTCVKSKGRCSRVFVWYLSATNLFNVSDLQMRIFFSFGIESKSSFLTSVECSLLSSDLVVRMLPYYLTQKMKCFIKTSTGNSAERLEADRRGWRKEGSLQLSRACGCRRSTGWRRLGSYHHLLSSPTPAACRTPACLDRRTTCPALMTETAQTVTMNLFSVTRASQTHLVMVNLISLD